MGLAVRTTSAGFVHVTVYVSPAAMTFVTVRDTVLVPTRLANVMDGVLRSAGMPGACGHAVFVAANTSPGVDMFAEHRNFM